MQNNVFELTDTEVKKLLRTLDGHPGEFTRETYIKLLDAVEESTNDVRDCELVYEKCIEVFQKCMNSTVLPRLLEKHGEWLLRELVHRWDNHKVMVRWMSATFYWLTEFYIKRIEFMDTLEEVGLECFREMAFRKIQANVTSIVLRLIGEELEGELIDSSLLKQVISIYGTIGIGFRDRLESDIIEHTRAFYASKASKLIFESSYSDYMVKAKECLRRRDTVTQYLRSTNKQCVVQMHQHELSQLLQNEHFGFTALLRDGKVEDLSRIFRLFLEIPLGRASFAVAFRQHVTAEGEALVQEVAQGTGSFQHADDTAKKQVLARNLIKLHDKYNSLMIDNFHDRDNYQALQEAFMEICSVNVPGMSIELAIFWDNILKKGVLDGVNKMLTDEEREVTIDKVVQLICCINDIDRFAEVYCCRLANRVLFYQSASWDCEVHSISKMKQALGGSMFTKKMEIMHNDVKASEEEFTCFRECCATNPNVHLETSFSVKVLPQSQWPTYEAVDIKLPKDMMKWMECFAKFYKRKWKHRKLEWFPSMGSCIIEVDLTRKKYNLHISTFQAALLLLFNDADRLRLSEIKNQLGLSDDMLGILVRSLTCGEYKILEKWPNTSTMEPNDEIVFNSNFVAEGKELKFPPHKLVDEKEVLEKEKNVLEKVDTFRSEVIRAALIRIAKSRKFVHHSDIIRECIKQVKGLKPSIKEMK
ncbi:hypothetical protein ABKV19_015287 [Rosa sericea]